MSKIAALLPGMAFQCRQRADGHRSFPYASDGIRQIFRVEPADVAEDSSLLWDRIHPDDVDRVAQQLDTAAAAMERWQCEYRARFPDGDERWHCGTALPERQADGSILWHGFITDVTDRKRAEEAHEQSRTLLQSVFSTVDLGVFLVEVTSGGDFRFVEINPAYERLVGIAAADMRGKSPRQLVPLIPPEMAECLRASFRRGTESESAIEYEEPFFVRGRLLWLLTRLAPVRDAGGNVVRLVGRSLDITERKTVELRFQSLTERLQLATDAAQVGIWDYDLTQEKIVWDKRMHALYGLDALAFDGTAPGWWQRVHREDMRRVEQEFREASMGGKALNSSFRITRPDGDVREIRASAHVQRNAAGRPVRMVGVNWDVTAERRAHAEVTRARDEAERLNQQLQEAVVRANELAREAAAATVAKSEFLANMSHEIRTPMNAVIGMSGLLLSTELNKDQREFAETIRSSGDSLLTLINDILDYSKIESGRLEFEQRSFRLRDCVEGSVDVLASRTAEKKLDLVCSVDPSVPPTVVGDETRLRQVIINLLSNAVKFTARGEVFLSVAIVGYAASSVRLKIAVHDSGIGIPPERMDRLFKTFSQVDASTTRQFGGTGLGLAISKRLVELMGGRIWVESTPGQGSVFYFEVELPVGVEAGAPIPLRTFPGSRVLVVEDNAANARVICQHCVSWQAMPRAVATAAEALALLREDDGFDLVLLDADLPDTDPLALAGQLRGSGLQGNLPVALLAWPGQLKVSDDSAIAGCINKPVKQQALRDLFTEILSGPRTPRPFAPPSSTLLGEEHPLEILIAEDNPVNQRVATLMLQRLGYSVEVVVNGREAVEAIERRRYDLVFMDVQMPEMDGLHATREICRRWQGRTRPRIVAMTASATVADREHCFAAGMDDFLPKPVRASDLRRALLATPAQKVASAA